MAVHDGVAWAWTRAEIGRRLSGWAVVALLLALTGGTVLAAVAGARRTASAFDRFLGSSLPPDVVVQVEPEVADRLARLPQVEQVARRAFLLSSPRGRG